MAKENAILDKEEQLNEDLAESFDFDALEEKLQSQLEEEIADMQFLAEEKEKIIAKKLSMIADKKCPSCGGTIGYNEKTDTYACDFCGTPFSLK